MDICDAKKVLICVSTLLLVSSCCVTYLGFMIYEEYLKYSEIVEPVYSFLPAVSYFAAATLLFIVGIIGFVAAFKRFQNFTAVYYACLLLVLTILGFAGAMTCLYSYSIKDSISADIDNAISFDYGQKNNSLLTNQVDNLQQDFQCCGIKGASDWSSSVWAKTHANLTFPQSCCYNKQCNETDPSEFVFKQGCATLLQNEYWNRLLIIFIFAASFIFIELVCMFVSCVILCRRHDLVYAELGNPEDVIS